MSPRLNAIRLGPRSVVAILATSAVGVVAFGWPLLVGDGTGLQHAADAPWFFAALLPLLLAVVLAEVADERAPAAGGPGASGAGGPQGSGAGAPRGMDAKAVALLGVLAAIGAALRPFGAGTAGLEPTLFLLVLAARVLGPGFGFVLGSVTYFASALLTAGVGPWLPFQMLGAAWAGLGAGLLPRRLTGRAEIAALTAYTAVAALLYGMLLNLWFWPFVAVGSGLSFVPGASVLDNLRRLVAFTAATSLGYDIPRAVLNGGLVLAVGPAVLRALRRAARRAAFDAVPRFGAGG
ncbi:MAG TPA: ECF transporter S component [Mycobacteriales bacterium]|nr:ECF transporter S component [Mycobacteriales bacterium]